MAHNGIARIVNSYFKDMANEDFAAYAIKTASCFVMSLKTPTRRQIEHVLYREIIYQHQKVLRQWAGKL